MRMPETPVRETRLFVSVQFWSRWFEKSSPIATFTNCEPVTVTFCTPVPESEVRIPRTRFAVRHEPVSTFRRSNASHDCDSSWMPPEMFARPLPKLPNVIGRSEEHTSELQS